MKKNIFVLISFIFLFGCELHQQEVSSLGKEANKEFQMETLSKMFASVISDDYFSLESMLSFDHDINVTNEQGQTLLIEAVKLKRVLISQLLIEHGANPQAMDSENLSPYDVVKNFSNKNVWENLLDGKGIDQVFLNQSVVQLVSNSAEDIQNEVIKKLTIFFKLGADVNSRNKRKFTLLILAATKNLPQIVTFLCETDGIHIQAKAGRYTALSLTQRLVRRNPRLKQIISIIKSYL